MNGLYQIQEFAELAGVTVKALHHYDRLGLLQPARSGSGYRMYTPRDLERLEQIVALKFLGVPLKRIKAVLDRPGPELAAALRLQRDALEEKQSHLARAIRAVRAAEESLKPGGAVDPATLRKIIEVIGVQNDMAVMKKYYSTDEAWEKRQRYYEEGPSQEWQALYLDVRAALGTDPASETAQALADRWLKLSARAFGGDPEVQTDSMTAWKDRDHWPPAMKRRLAEFQMEEANAFIQQAALAARKKYFSDDAWTRRLAQLTQSAQQFSVLWQARVDLFHDIVSALDEDPAGEKAQSLAARWMDHIDMASAGDAGIKDGLQALWQDRRNWPATLRWMEESFCRLTGDCFDQAADFLDRATAARLHQPG